MARARATSREWQQYYERAERVHAAVGDPFRRYAKRLASRHRLYLCGIAIYAVAVVVAFIFVAAG